MGELQFDETSMLRNCTAKLKFCSEFTANLEHSNYILLSMRNEVFSLRLSDSSEFQYMS